jgi:hypothetical protein
MRSPTKRGSSNTVKQTAGICVIIAAGIGLLMLIPNNTFFTKQVQPILRDGTAADQAIGEIRLEPTQDGRCRVIAFDNRSGRFWDKGLMPCDPDPSAQEPVGRLDSISKSFKSH